MASPRPAAAIISRFILLEYQPGHDAVFLRHPDGHNVEAVNHGTPA